MKDLLTFINSKIRLDEIATDKLASICTKVSYKKGDYLLKTGSYCRHLYFINKGLVKLSFDTGESEFIMRFFEENILLTELDSLSKNKPSKYQIVALEDIECTKITFDAFENLCQNNPKIAAFYSKFLTIAHVNMMDRISEMLESDARIRYNNFLAAHSNSNILNRISLGDLSKYLGINQVTLSRIRRKK